MSAACAAADLAAAATGVPDKILEKDVHGRLRGCLDGKAASITEQSALRRNVGMGVLVRRLKP
jgi:hypothetical protein